MRHTRYSIGFMYIVFVLLISCGNPRDNWKNSIGKAEMYARQGEIDKSVREYNKTLKYAHAIDEKDDVDWPYSDLMKSIDKSKLPFKKKLSILMKIFKFVESQSYRYNTPDQIRDALVPAISNLDMSYNDKLEMFKNEFELGDNFNQASLEIIFDLIRKSSLTHQDKTHLFEKVFDKAWSKIKTFKPVKEHITYFSEPDELYLRVIGRAIAGADYLDSSKRIDLAYRLLDKASSGYGQDFDFTGSALLYGKYEKQTKLKIYNQVFKIVDKNEKEWTKRPICDFFDTYIENYFIQLINSPIQTQLSQKPLLKGKVLPVRVDTRINKSKSPETKYQVDVGFYYELPDDLLAKNPSEVKYLLLIEYIKSLVGRYTSGGPAYKINIKIKLIDITLPGIICEKIFYGTDNPPSVIHVLNGQKGEGEGNAPIDEVIKYLNKISQK